MSQYTRIAWRGQTFNKRTVAMIEAAEEILGYQLTIFQGSYNAGEVQQSAGTHDGGGAVDVWGKTGDQLNVVKALRQVGFAAWVRDPSQGNWGFHIHAIALGDREASQGAKDQMTDYRAGRNGLANNGSDTFWRPNPIPVFRYYTVDLSNTRAQFKAKKPRPIRSVRLIQHALKARGYDIAVDGIAGPQTKRAFRRWAKWPVPTKRNLHRLGFGYFKVKD